MPLLRGIARTAVIAGTATAVSNRVSRRQEGRWARQSEAAAQPAPAAPPAAPDAGGQDPLAQLRELGDLRDRGVLTEEEFEQQKRRILGS
jgi:hypothetical protein